MDRSEIPDAVGGTRASSRRRARNVSCRPRPEQREASAGETALAPGGRALWGGASSLP